MGWRHLRPPVTSEPPQFAEVIEMATFVLVHGAFGSPAELAPVIPLLEASGHRAIAVDLPCTDPKATLDDYARTVVEAMAGIEGPVVVVGHSAGGATISLVPGRTRVDRLVYVTAVVPEPGRSIADVVGADVREMMLSVSHDDGNGCRSFDLEMLASLAPPPPEEREAYLTFFRATLRPQGWAALEQPWPSRSLPDVPRNYVLCTEDKIIPPAKQREMAARLGVEPIEIASEHAVSPSSHASSPRCWRRRAGPSELGIREVMRRATAAWAIYRTRSGNSR
jgi:pimeloyl-ACP methyl ester carboxylesterase